MRINKLGFACLVVAIQLLSTFAPAQTITDASLPGPGKPIERELRGGEAHSYAVHLNAGQFLEVVVDQRGIDVVVTLSGPDGKTLIEVDSPNGIRGPEPVASIARDSGLHKVEVRSLEKNAAAARYEIRLEALRIATAEDIRADRIKHLAAMLATAKSEDEGAAMLAKEPELVTEDLWKRLNERGRSQTGERALITHRIGLRIAQQAGHKLGIATSLNNIGATYHRRNDLKPALEYFQKSLPIAEEIGEKRLIALLLLNLGDLYRQQGNLTHATEYHLKSLEVSQEIGAKPGIVAALLGLGNDQRLSGNPGQALESFRKALSIAETLTDKTPLAQTFFNLGLFHRIQSNFSESLDYYLKELQLREELGAKPAVANALVNIGYVLRFQGDYARALEYYERALKLNEEIDAKGGIADALSSIGELHRLQGNYARALEYHQRSLALSEDLKNKEGLAREMHRMGIVHRLQGNNALAMDYFQKDLQLYTELGLKGLMADSLNSIGVVHYENKNYAAALEYFGKSVALAEQVGSKRSLGIGLINSASVLRDQGHYTKAIEYYGKTLVIAEAINDSELLSYVHGEMAETYRRQNDFAKALDLANRSAAIAARLGIRDVLWNSLITAGQAYYSLNELDKALEASEKAISIIESMRSGIGGQEARASYFETAQKSYQLRIDTLMRLHRQQPSKGRDAEALLANESARARSLIEALNEAQANIREGVDPDLLARERSLQRQLNARADQQARLLARKHGPEEAANLRNEVESLAVKLREARSEISLKSPRYSALAQPVPLKLSEIQQLLDPETLLLEYSLGEEQSHLWAVSPNSIQSFELPKRSEIETQVRAIVRMLSDGKSWATGATVDNKYEDAIANLGRSLWPSTLTSEARVKRLLIVADGALQYLPFSALPSPKSRNKNAPLIADFEVVNLPSASTLAILRRETGNRASAAQSVAVLADPVFEETDQRVLAVNRSAATPGSKVRDAASPEARDSRAILDRALRVESNTDGDGGQREVLKISRLPFTRFEAEGILASAPRTQSFKATDFRANRETATSAELSKYRFIHFATHGILNTEHPELSGVVLSLVDEKGQPVDGFLRLHEIYNLNFPADLVVLSACQTGLGKEIRGEGLVGLTRGFMYAGAPRVVASLWKVDDAATAELMKRFYRGMLKDNLRPAAALRTAKIEMWKQKRWNAPFYWAAFELQGEWR